MEQVHDVRILWLEEWYDGPLTGVAEHAGERFWFTPLAESWWQERPRRFVLRRLSAPEAGAMDQRMEDSRAMQPDAYWSKYHSTERNEGGYEEHESEPVGWFAEQ